LKPRRQGSHRTPATTTPHADEDRAARRQQPRGTAVGITRAASAAETLSSIRVDQRPVRILAETERYRITGVVFLPPDGYRSRLSDYLNTPEHAFLALTDVELTPLSNGGPAEQHRFLALSLQHIVFAVPLDQQA
jgi:hypothetical protein